MRPGRYQEIMTRIGRSKKAELVREAQLPFTQKLALSATASRSGNNLTFSETFSDPILEVAKLFNLAVKQGTFERYALAGGLAVDYYGAPINTTDDFLVVFPETVGGLLDAFAFFEFFQRNGASLAGEYLEFHGLKFQMIPANRPLDNEALQAAISASEKGVSFFVVSLEHLIALKLNAWRYKDRLHINHLLDSGVLVDNEKLNGILQRHQLEARWNEFLTERARKPE